MLSQLLFVRLKAAENALRDGRLDEAYRLAGAADLREHRRGAAVLAALTERFLQRAREHFRADRFTEALMDLDKAETGGVMKVQIAELRQHVLTVAAEQQRREQSRRKRVEAAKRRIEGGSLAAGRGILEQASGSNHVAKELQREVEDRAGEARVMAEQAEKLIAQGQLAAAAGRLRRAKSTDAHSETVTRVETRLCNQVFENARAAIDQGRLARASDELACLGELGDALPTKREVTDLLAIAQEAMACVQADQYTEARRHAMTLGRLLPDAPWVQKVIEQLQGIDAIKIALCAGPLGDRMDWPGEKEGKRPIASRGLQAAQSPGQAKARGRPEADTVALPGRVRRDADLPERLLLLVDGGGSYLLLRGDRVSLGRVASDTPPDVPIFSDVAERHASVARMEDDYFLFSSKEVEVAGVRTQHQLLRDGDRIVLGRKAKFTFRLPSRKSPTAVLDLSDTTKMPNDVRRVVLFHHHATVGAGPTAHIRCQHAGPSLVLFERNGALWMRQKSDGHVDTEAVQLHPGEPVEIAGASLVLQPWELRTPGSGKV